MSRISYTYSVIRYVHDAVSGECLNIAVVLHSPRDNKVEVRAPASLTRVHCAFPGASTSLIRSAVQAIDAGLQASISSRQGLSLDEALKSVIHDDSSSLQFSRIGAGVSASLELAAEELLERFVTRWEETFDRGEVWSNRADHAIWINPRVIDAPSNDSSWDILPLRESECA